MREPVWTRDRLRRLVNREIGDYRIVVVSNRQPYVHELVDGELRVSTPAGGVTTAIDPLMQECAGTWIAHGSGAGDYLAVDDRNRVMVPPDDPSYTLRLMWLTDEEQQGYYYGVSNDGLWPLCHNAYIEPTFDQADWDTYTAVNRAFANQVLEEIGGGPAAVFIQDYHLALLPRFLRDADPDVITGQFWHIPWPNYEIFRICPWQDELLDGLAGQRYAGLPHRRPLRQLHGSGPAHTGRPRSRRIQPGLPPRRRDAGAPRSHQRGLRPTGNRRPERRGLRRDGAPCLRVGS